MVLLMMRQLHLFWPCVACVLLAGCAGDRAARTPNVRSKLAGTNWIVESIDGQRVTVLDEAKPLQLVLSETDQRVAAHGGVNRFGGTYRVENDRLSFGPLLSTKMASTTEMNRQEQAFANALSQSNRYEIDGDTLVLLSDDRPRIKLRADR